MTNTDTRQALARKLVDDFAVAFLYGNVAQRIAAGDAIVAALATQPAQPRPNFSLIWTICRFALHSPTEVLMHQIERLANELSGEEQQRLQALLIRARNPKAQKPASRLVPSTQPSAQSEAVAMDAEIEMECLSAWNASTYGHSAEDTVHPMFLSAFKQGYRASKQASAPAAPAQAVPLTVSELIKLWGDKSDGPSNAEIVAFARAIERAHGIFPKETK